MILDSLQNSKMYEGLHPKFKQAFDYIKTTDFSKQEIGKVELDGKNLIVIFAEGIGKTMDEAKMETHEQYIDIQVPYTSVETMGYIPTVDLKNPTVAYNSEKDIAFFSDKATAFITVHPGQFAIFFPEDGHQPAIGDGPFRKIIVKVKV
ncbi:MAG: YhcH/YjgK/YiaL family protein [Paludibacteraceae bacterium]|nr:YhcH/YjgK/YiaL family protein [Paludibacteraceae bacterium]